MRFVAPISKLRRILYELAIQDGRFDGRIEDVANVEPVTFRKLDLIEQDSFKIALEMNDNFTKGGYFLDDVTIGALTRHDGSGIRTFFSEDQDPRSDHPYLSFIDHAYIERHLQNRKRKK